MSKRVFIFMSVLFVAGLAVQGQDDTLPIQAFVDSLTSLQTRDTSTLVIPRTGNDIKPPDMGELISGYKVFWSLVFIGLGYLIIRLLSFVLNVLAERSTKYRIAFKGAIPIVKIVGWILVTTLIIVGIFQPPAATVLAFSASIGVAVGFASQDLLKNIFGGIIIIIDQPFKSGDKIEVGSHYGEVVEIGLRSTRIVTPDDSLVSIPNSEIMNSYVSNANAGEANCQVVAEFYLPPDVDTLHVRSLATQAAMISKYVYLNKPIIVLFAHELHMGKSFLKMKLKAYVRDIRDEFIFKSDMTELVIRELVSEGIVLPERDGNHALS